MPQDKSVKPLPADQAVFDLIQTRKQELDTYYKDYSKALRDLERKAIATGGTVVGDVPAAPPAV
jgi:hypothetical protein